MAIPKQPSSCTLLLLALATLSFTATSSAAADCSGAGAGAISVYWGQKPTATEGTLESLCSSGNYNIVLLQSLVVHDNGSTPELNLADHCGNNPCSKLQSEIEYCQKNNIKVLISIGIEEKKALRTENRYYSKSNNLKTTKAAEKLANYILENYLSGKPGPLGNVTLDGIDIADVPEGDNIKWDEFVKAVNASTSARKIYLSASPQCVYPDAFLGPAIRTGLFDYIWVEFYYQNPCIYTNGDASKLLSAWKTWTTNVPKSKIFLGLVASDELAGYIPPQDLISKVLPTAKEASNYGGVMIWERNYDLKTNYTAQIKDSVPKGCRCVCDGDDAFAYNSFYGLGSAPLRVSA
ncbi:hypothetical protein VNO78_32939 [Psophocarpus tetragonolobus]|uniref:GH18 domain-containing protein n=1 Tax=Psophocarpus tetragonolobus TaxID=3891 RepID=A0AAN9NW56_PSOTE